MGAAGAEAARRSLVLDSSAFVSNARVFTAAGEQYFGTLDGSTKAYSVDELVYEVRDASARERLRTMAGDICFREPGTESLNAVKAFARQSGDLASLSVVDLKIIALTYELEVEQNGLRNVRKEPKPIIFKLPQKHYSKQPQQDDSGQQREETENDGWETAAPKKTRGRGAKGVSKQATPAESTPETAAAAGELPAAADATGSTAFQQQINKLFEELEEVSFQEQQAVQVQQQDPSAADEPGEAPESADLEDCQGSEEKEWRDLAVGSSESEGSDDAEEAYEDDTGDWDDQEYDDEGVANLPGDSRERAWEQAENEEDEEDDDAGWINPDNLTNELEKDLGVSKKENSTSHIVGCVTTDYAMQNVILQMGLKLLSVDGNKVIKSVRRYILRCSACATVTREVERLFCPNCGNNALVKLPFSIDKRGIARIYYDPNRWPSLRGTKYSVPKPKGGRNNKDLILCEDQIEMRMRQRPRRGKKTKADIFDPNTKYNAGARMMQDQRIVAGYGRTNPNVARHRPKK